MVEEEGEEEEAEGRELRAWMMNGGRVSVLDEAVVEEGMVVAILRSVESERMERDRTRTMVNR